VQLLLKLLRVLATLNGRDRAGLVIIVTAVSAWITGVQMRRKIRRELGRKATDADLASLDTWMKVDEAEQQNKRSRPLEPD
jgi:hypothetical protein